MDRRRFLHPRPATREPHPLPAPEPPPYAGGLTPFAPSAAAPWDLRRATHFVVRTGFGHDTDRVASAATTTPSQAVSSTIDAAVAVDEPPRPSWADLLKPRGSAPEAERRAYQQANRAGLIASRTSVVSEALGLRREGSPLRERMAFLWHSVLPIASNVAGNRAQRNYEYWSTLRRHAFGRYDELVPEIGRTMSMLGYLDGRLNRVGRPNENYAREVLELFTMGITGPDGTPNYTQQDIAELARAMTGWTTPGDSLVAVFNPRRFDETEKTVFGVTAPLDFDSAHALLFSERRQAITHHVCRHLYREFVHDVPNEQVVGEMAEVMDASDFEIEPVVRTLLASSHFFSDGAIGAKIKGPFEHAIGLLQATGAEYTDELAYAAVQRGFEAGQRPFDPPDVSGWNTGRRWLDTSALPTRWITSDRAFNDPSLAQEFVGALPNPYDPYAIVDDSVERLIVVPVAESVRNEAVEILLSGIPDYEWDPTAPTAAGRIRATLRFIARLPEFQLT